MQALHNGVIVDAGNSSASLDPKQIPNDANDKLLKGAAAFAAGKTLGLSEEEVLAAVSRQARAERRAALGPQRLTEEETINDIFRQASQAQAALGKAEITDPNFVTYYDTVSEGQPIDANTEQTYGPDDREYVGPDERASRESRQFSRQEARDKRRAKIEQNAARTGGRVFKNALVSGSDFGEDTGSADLENPKRGVSEFGFGDRIVPTSAKIAEESRKRSQESVEALGSDERLRLSGSGEQRALNDERAAVEAASLARNAGTFPSRPIIVGPGSGEMMLQYEDPSRFSTATEVDGVYVDPRSGAPVEISEPATDVFAGSNTPNTGQQLNAPSTQSATEFVSKMVNQGTTNSANRPMQPVAIGAVLGGLDDAVTAASQARRFSGLRERVPAQITSLDNFQKTTDAILAMAAESGKPLGATIGGSRVTTSEPGIREALDAMGIKNEFEQEKIAVALQNRGQGPTMVFDPASGRLVPDALPLKGFSYGAKSVRGFPKNSELGQALQQSGVTLDPGTRERAIGAAKEQPMPQVTKVVGPVDDVAATKRLQYLKGPMGKGGNLVQQAAEYLRRQGNPSPTFGEAMDLIESGMERRVQAGTKPLDEANLARTIARTEKVASRPDESEFSAMARLLGGPLRPAEPEVERASSYERSDPEMTPGAVAAIQEERAKNRGPGAIPNDPEMSELIRIARRMR